MVPYGPPDIKFSVEIPKSPFGDIENFTKLAHDPIPPYHSAVILNVIVWPLTSPISVRSHKNITRAFNQVRKQCNPNPASILKSSGH